VGELCYDDSQWLKAIRIAAGMPKIKLLMAGNWLDVGFRQIATDGIKTTTAGKVAQG